MGKEMKFSYDRSADILYINLIDPYPTQETEEVGDDVVVRLNPETGEIESLEVLFFSTRLLRDDIFRIPVVGSMHLSNAGHGAY
ncbi:MAG TPA: DUF2283 domain-containing protein [Spirochaetota bacterium]|nr:DUF2283 domain-containing protein [Spirochaetota bacterium]